VSKAPCLLFSFIYFPFLFPLSPFFHSDFGVSVDNTHYCPRIPLSCTLVAHPCSAVPHSHDMLLTLKVWLTLIYIYNTYMYEIPTHTHTHTHTHAHTHTHTYTPSYVYMLIRTRRIHTVLHWHLRFWTFEFMYVYMHFHTFTHAYTKYKYIQLWINTLNMHHRQWLRLESVNSCTPRLKLLYSERKRPHTKYKYIQL